MDERIERLSILAIKLPKLLNFYFKVFKENSTYFSYEMLKKYLFLFTWVRSENTINGL